MPMSKLLGVSALLLTVAADAPEARPPEIRFGILPRLPPAEITAMFTPLAEHLTRETGRKVRLVIADDFAGFKDQVRGGEIDLAFSNPLVYVQLKRHLDLQPLGLGAEKRGGARFRGAIVVRKDSAIFDVSELRGKKIVFVDEDSLGGYVSQALLLKKEGLDVRRDLVLLPFARSHDKVTRAVFDRVADAGGVREDDLEKMQGKVDLWQLKVLAYSEYFPNWPFYAGAHVDAPTREAIRAALLKLKPGDPALEAAHLIVIAPVTDKEYDGLRAAARTVGKF